MAILAGAAATLALAAAACGGAAHEAGAYPAELRVTQLHVPGSGYAVEGSYSYIRVQRGAGETVAEQQLSLSDPPQARLRLDPGSYRIVSYQRNCDGTCTLLDPPSDSCSRAVEVAPGATIALTIRLRPGQGCSFAPTT